MGLFKFLKSLRTLANNKNITIEEAYKFAKQEFGEVNDLLKLQINKIFKDVEAPSIKLPKKPEGKVIEASFKPGKSKYSDKIIEESPSQKSGTIMDRLSGAANRLEELMKEREAMYKPKQGLQVSEGLTRTLARKILDRKRIQVPKGQDPINVFTDIFGESINDVKNLADEMVEIDQAGGGMKNMDEMLEAEGLYDIDVPESPQRGLTDEELQKLTTEEPEDFAVGGRVGFQKGSSKIFDQLEMDVPHPYGHRVEYAAGGGVKALLKMLNKKLGKGTVDTVENLYKKGELKVNPNKQKYDEDRKAVFDFNMRQLNKTEADANKEMDALIKDQIEGGFIRDMEKSMQRDMQRELKKPAREILDVPPVPEGFKLSKEKLMAKFPEIDESFADEMVNMDKDTAGRLIKMLENRRLDPEAYDRLLAEYGDTLEFQAEFDKVVRRKNNNQGGLNYLMGM